MMGGIMVESYIDGMFGSISEDIDKYIIGGLASIEIMMYQWYIKSISIPSHDCNTTTSLLRKYLVPGVL